MDTFSVGEICEVAQDVFGRAPHTVGEDCVITQGASLRISGSGVVDVFYEGFCCDSYWLFKECELRKKRPPSEYDGNQVTKWDDCPFKPREMVRV